MLVLTVNVVTVSTVQLLKPKPHTIETNRSVPEVYTLIMPKTRRIPIPRSFQVVFAAYKPVRFICEFFKILVGGVYIHVSSIDRNLLSLIDFSLFEPSMKSYNG